MAGLRGFIEDARRLGVEFNSLLAWQGGRTVAQADWWPYTAQRVHMMHSCTKSFLSAAVGLAVQEGRFGLQDPVLRFFPDHAPRQPHPHLARMTVEDLLTQTSGHAQGASGSIWRAIRSSWITEFFRIPVVYAPGTHFRYTSATSFLLSAILTRSTGMTAQAYLQPRLLEPLGITELRWDLGPEDINPGGNGISCSTDSLLKLAVLHLRGGVWEGRQLLPADWVRRATTPQRGNPYGYHWWAGPGGAFYAYGVFGQFAVAFPQQDAVVAMTAAVPPGEETLRSLIWHHFPRAFEDVSLAEGLRLLPVLPGTSSEVAVQDWNGRWTAQENADGLHHLEVSIDAHRCVLRFEDSAGTHTVEAGLQDWIEGDTTLPGAALHHGYEPDRLRVVAGAQWESPQRLRLTLQFVETSFRDTLLLTREGDALLLERSVNVNSQALLRPPVRLLRAG